MKRNSIIGLVTSFRKAIEKAQAAGEFNNDIPFKIFPRSCC